MTRSVICKRSEAGKSRSSASVCNSDAWSAAMLSESQAVCSTVGPSRRSDTTDVELGIAWQWPHGAEDDGCKPSISLGVAFWQHDFATGLAQQECCVAGADFVGSTRPLLAASI